MVELRLTGITKKFGSFIANDHISLRIKQGTIHGILGENGAGKSTLMNILSGLDHPDEGAIYLDNQLAKINSSKNAIDYGIGMIHQHFMLVPQLSVLENIILGIRNHWKLNLTQKKQEIKALAESYELEINLDAKVANISVGMQQRVEILKVLYRGAKLLILDEPTAVLSPSEIGNFFRILRQFVNQGNTIIFISHKLKEVINLCDQITILRNGKAIKTIDNSNLNSQTLAKLMVGDHKVIKLTKQPSSSSETVLSLKNLDVTDHRKVGMIKNISIDIKGGEILGIAGVDGNGQQELVASIMGFTKPSQGQILYNDIDITHWTAEKRIKELSIAYIPEDRQKTGLVSSLSVGKNLILKQYDRFPFNHWGILQKKAIQTLENQAIVAFDIRGIVPNLAVGKLSGGNQQKIVLARELSNHPQLIIAMQPTRGLDIAATEYIQQKLLESRNNGAAILYVSTELEEVRKISDRLAIMYQGEVIAVVNPDTDLATIGSLMAGVKVQQ